MGRRTSFRKNDKVEDLSKAVVSVPQRGKGHNKQDVDAAEPAEPIDDKLSAQPRTRKRKGV